MNKKVVTIMFNLDSDRDKRLYTGILNLPNRFGGDISEAFMQFLDSMIVSLSECEEEKKHYENLLMQITGRMVIHREANA